MMLTVIQVLSPSRVLSKSKSYWVNSNTFNSLVPPKEAFPSVKWEDNEPIRVIIRLAQYDYKKKHFRKYTCHYQ